MLVCGAAVSFTVTVRVTVASVLYGVTFTVATPDANPAGVIAGAGVHGFGEPAL